MPQLVSITTQGQISIPVQIRRELKLDKYRKALVSRINDRVVVEPVSDLLDLGGSLQERALKNKSITQVRKQEKEAMTTGFSGQLA